MLARNHDKSILWWFFLNIFMIFFMIIIGGITRLTDSGLSITSWNLIQGIAPPLNENDWYNLFNQYKNTPEFKLTNFDMNIYEFKKIFFWEYLHRIWGRLLGLVFLGPLIYYWIKRRFLPKQKRLLIILALLGFFQAFMGWFMVKSGLIDKPDVSHFRLSIHLTTAFIIYSLLIFMFWEVYRQKSFSKEVYNQKNLKLKKYLNICIFFLSLTIISGAFVAGTDAGLAFNNFPLMGDHFFPPILLSSNVISFANLFYDIGFLQFIHRVIATTTLIIIILTFLRNFRKYTSGFLKKTLYIMLITTLVQYSLGITILRLYVPTILGLFHQSFGLVILTILVLMWSEIEITSRKNKKSVLL